MFPYANAGDVTQGYETKPGRSLYLLLVPMAAALVILAAVGALSSPSAASLAIIAALALIAVGATRLVRPFCANPTFAVRVAWYSASALAGLVLLLGARDGLAFFAYMALLFVGWVETTSLAQEPQGNESRVGTWLLEQKMLLATFAALLLAWVPFWLSYFPGIMSPDSLSAWTQALTFRLNDYSPAVYTLYIWLTGTPLGTPAAASLVQLLLTAALIAALFSYLDRHGARRWLLAAGLALYIGLPIFGTFTVTLWHDILYSLLVLWVTHAMYLSFVSKGQWLAVRGHSWALGAALLLIPLFAHNGLSVVFGVLAGALLVLRGQRRRVLAIAAGWLASFLLVQMLVYPMLGIRPYSKAFASEALIHQISNAITQHGTSGLTASEKAYLQQIMPFKDWVQKYNPYTPQFLVSKRFNPSYNESPIDHHYSEFLKVWADIGMRYPGSYLNERVTENALVLRPTGNYKIALSGLRISSNSIGLKTRSVAQTLLDTLRRIANFTTTNMIWLWRPFWVMWLLLALTIAGVVLRGRVIAFAAIPWIFQVLGLAISIQGQSVRYYYSLFLILPYLLAIVFMQRHRAVSSPSPRLFGRTLRSPDGAAREGAGEPL